jgi:hypothetical protein
MSSSAERMSANDCLQRLDVELRARGLLVDLRALRLEPLRGARDQLSVVALIACTFSSTIFWFASASASVTATWSALTVTFMARFTPRISSLLFG